MKKQNLDEEAEEDFISGTQENLDQVLKISTVNWHNLKKTIKLEEHDYDLVLIPYAFVSYQSSFDITSNDILLDSQEYFNLYTNAIFNSILAFNDSNQEELIDDIHEIVMEDKSIEVDDQLENETIELDDQHTTDSINYTPLEYSLQVYGTIEEHKNISNIYSNWILTDKGLNIFKRIGLSLKSVFSLSSCKDDWYIKLFQFLDDYHLSDYLFNVSNYLVVKTFKNIDLTWYKHLTNELNQHININYLYYKNLYTNRQIFAIWLVLIIIAVSSSATFLGFAYLSIWTMIASFISTEFPSKYEELRDLVDSYLFNGYMKEFTRPVFVPILKGDQFLNNYRRFYLTYMEKRAVPKLLTDPMHGDLLRIHRTLIQKSLILPKTLWQRSRSYRQKLGHGNYKGYINRYPALDYLYNSVVNHQSWTHHSISQGFQTKRKSYEYLHYRFSAELIDFPMIASKPFLLDTSGSVPIHRNYIQEQFLSKFNSLYYKDQLLPYKTYLLIGKPNAGKAYLSQSVALNINLPLVSINTERLFRTRRELLIEFNLYSDSGMRPMLDRRVDESTNSRLYHKLIKIQILVRLAEKIAPCVVWIPFLQNYTSDWYSNAKTKGLLCLLMTLVIESLVRNNNLLRGKRTMMFFAGCDNTRHLDPVLLHYTRFHRLIRLENPTPLEREERLLGLLRSEGMNMSKDFDFTTIRNATMGYTMRDINGLVERMYRMCMNLRSYTINTVLMSEAVKEQQEKVYMSKAGGYIDSREYVAYKVGKGLVKSVMFPQPLFHLNTFLDDQFYYLSKWYLETKATGTVVTPNVMLTYFYTNLAGIAAKDAWIMLSNGYIDENTVISSLFTDDIGIALNIFRAYYSELSSLTIQNKNLYSVSKNISFAPDTKWREGRLLSILGEYDLDKAHYLDADISISIEEFYGAPHVDLANPYRETRVNNNSVLYRVPIYHHFLFDLEKHISDTPSIYSILRYGTKEQLSQTFRRYLTNIEYWYRKTKFIHSRFKPLEPKDFEVMYKRATEKKSFFTRRSEKKKWNKHVDNLVKPTEYYNLSTPVLLRDKHPIWNPKPVFPRHLEFQKRHLSAHRLTMSTIFNVYIDKPDPSKIIMVKKPFWFRDEAQEKLEDRIEDIIRAVNQTKEESKEEKKQRKRQKYIDREHETCLSQSLIIPPYTKMLRPKFYKKVAVEVMTLEDNSRYCMSDETNFDIWFQLAPLEGLIRHDLAIDHILYDQHNIPLEIFMHTHATQTYNAIYRWFIKHKDILVGLVGILSKEGVIWPEQLSTALVKNSTKELPTVTRIYENYINNQEIQVREWLLFAIRNCFAGTGGDSNRIVELELGERELEDPWLKLG